MEKRKLEGQIAIITGSSSGIGAGCAKEMAKAGATVSCQLSCARRTKKWQNRSLMTLILLAV